MMMNLELREPSQTLLHWRELNPWQVNNISSVWQTMSISWDHIIALWSKTIVMWFWSLVFVVCSYHCWLGFLLQDLRCQQDCSLQRGWCWECRAWWGCSQRWFLGSDNPTSQHLGKWPLHCQHCDHWSLTTSHDNIAQEETVPWSLQHRGLSCSHWGWPLINPVLLLVDSSRSWILIGIGHCPVPWLVILSTTIIACMPYISPVVLISCYNFAFYSHLAGP